MIKKILSLVSLTIAALAFTGCDGGSAQMGPKEANGLGIVKVEKANYGSVGNATIDVATDDLYTRKNVSGDKVTLLWGLFTITDY